IRSAWLPESATEWADSASMEEDPVARNATNFPAAIAKFASRAAMIALVPPLALTRTPQGSAKPILVRSELRERGDPGRIPAIAQGEVNPGIVAQTNQGGEPLQRVSALGGDLGHRHAAVLGEPGHRLPPLGDQRVLLGVAEQEQPRARRAALLAERVGVDRLRAEGAV